MKPALPKPALVLPLLLAATAAAASTPAAWEKERHQAAAVCLGEADLSAARATPVAAFDDRTALDAMLVTGLLRRGPPVSVTMLCLYDRRTHRATAVETRGWPAVKRRD